MTSHVLNIGGSSPEKNDNSAIAVLFESCSEAGSSDEDADDDQSTISSCHVPWKSADLEGVAADLEKEITSAKQDVDVACTRKTETDNYKSDARRITHAARGRLFDAVQAANKITNTPTVSLTPEQAKEKQTELIRLETAVSFERRYEKIASTEEEKAADEADEADDAYNVLVNTLETLIVAAAATKWKTAPTTVTQPAVGAYQVPIRDIFDSSSEDDSSDDGDDLEEVAALPVVALPEEEEEEDATAAPPAYHSKLESARFELASELRAATEGARTSSVKKLEGIVFRLENETAVKTKAAASAHGRDARNKRHNLRRGGSDDHTPKGDLAEVERKKAAAAERKAVIKRQRMAAAKAAKAAKVTWVKNSETVDQYDHIVASIKGNTTEFHLFKPGTRHSQQGGGYLLEIEILEEHLFKSDVGKALKQELIDAPGKIFKIKAGASSGDGSGGDVTYVDSVFVHHSGGLMARLETLNGARPEPKRHVYHRRGGVDGAPGDDVTYVDSVSVHHSGGLMARVETLSGARPGPPQPVPYPQGDDDVCVEKSNFNAIHLAGDPALAHTLSTNQPMLTANGLRNEADNKGVRVEGMHKWYGNFMIDQGYKHALQWMFDNPEAYAEHPIAITLNLKNGKKKHAVVAFNGLCYDPNNQFTFPFDREHLGDEYTGVTEGYRFSLTKKALKRKRA
jgi:hypothetical protein